MDLNRLLDRSLNLYEMLEEIREERFQLNNYNKDTTFGSLYDQLRYKKIYSWHTGHTFPPQIMEIYSVDFYKYDKNSINFCYKITGYRIDANQREIDVIYLSLDDFREDTSRNLVLEEVLFKKIGGMFK